MVQYLEKYRTTAGIQELAPSEQARISVWKQKRRWEVVELKDCQQQESEGKLLFHSLLTFSTCCITAAVMFASEYPGPGYCITVLYTVTCVLSPFCHVWLCDPTDCNTLGSFVHGILQARILEWVVMPFSKGSFWPRDQTRISYVCCIGRQILYHWAAWEAQCCVVKYTKAQLVEDAHTWQSTHVN